MSISTFGSSNCQFIAIDNLAVEGPSYYRTSKMLCHVCNIERTSKFWRPCQWKARRSDVEPYNGCKVCDRLDDQAMQLVVDKVEWRWWYFQHDQGLQHFLDTLLEETWNLPGYRKELLHEGFHSNPAIHSGARCGEKICSKICRMVCQASGSGFLQSTGLDNSRKLADLMESAIESAYEGGNGSRVESLVQLMALVHYGELQRDGDRILRYNTFSNFYEIFDHHV